MTRMIVLPGVRRSGANAAGASASVPHGPDDRLEPAVAHPLGQVRELGAIGFDDEEDRPPVLGRTSGGAAMVTSVPPARTSAAERSRISPPITSNTTSTSPTSSSRSACRSTKASAPRPSARVPVGGPAGADHAGARLARELHRDRSDTARRAVDQDGLAGREAPVVEQALPCGQPGDRQRGGHGVVDVGRQRSEVARLHRDVLGQRARCGSSRSGRTPAGRRSGRSFRSPARRRHPTPRARARSASGRGRRDRTTFPASRARRG